MKLYGISGLGADKRVFEYLKLNYPLTPIEWIDSLKNETIENYSLQLSKLIDTKEDYGIMGVSFGGLIAVEISKRLNPKLTILISSAETKRELRTIYRIIGKTKLLRIITRFLFDPPCAIAYWVFGAKNKHILNHILDDTDLKFAKWAVNELTTWKNNEKLTNPILKIAGTNDKLIPPQDVDHQILIDHGEHFMILDKADEISTIINNQLKTLIN